MKSSVRKCKKCGREFTYTPGYSKSSEFCYEHLPKEKP
jgi:transposase-like protein